MAFLDFSQWIPTNYHLIALYGCAILIGMSKTGIQGINTISIPILAMMFGAKESTGLVLPMLCMADLVAVIYYRRMGEWKYIVKLLPAAVAGFFVALAVDQVIPASQFKRLMAVCILIGLVIMFWTERKGKQNVVGDAWWYAPLFGLLGGFTTMIGNAAGPVMAVYLLSMRLPKYCFVGTTAWFFLIINLLKLPLQIFAWDNITLTSFALNLSAIPFILLGAVVGIKFVKILPESKYRIFIVITTLISTLLLLF